MNDESRAALAARHAKVGQWTEERCVEVLVRYFDSLRADKRGGQKDYLEWQRDKDDAPPPSRFGEYGGYTILAKKPQTARAARGRRLRARAPGYAEIEKIH